MSKVQDLTLQWKGQMFNMKPNVPSIAAGDEEEQERESGAPTCSEFERAKPSCITHKNPYVAD